MFVSIIVINSHIPVMFEENSVKLLSWIPLKNLEYCCSYWPWGNRIQEDPEHFKIAYITSKAFEFQYVVDALSFLLSPLNFLVSKKFPETFFSLPFQTIYNYSSKCRHRKIYFSSLNITIREKNVGFTVFLLITHCSLFREKEDGKPLKQNIL